MTVASDFTGLLAGYCKEFNLASEVLSEVIASAGLGGSNHPEHACSGRIPYRKWCVLLEKLFERTNDLELGIHIGGIVKPAHCGVLGYLAVSAKSLGEALFQFERYQCLLYGGSRAQPRLIGDRLRVDWPIHESRLGVGLSDEILLYGLINFFRIMLGNQLDGDDGRGWLQQTSLSFAHAPIAPLPKYQTHGIGEVLFSQSTLSLSVPAAILTLPIRTHDPDLFEVLNRQARILLTVLPDGQDDFEQSVRHYLHKALPEGAPTLDSLARAISLSSRTVRRRLADRGLTFGSVLRETRAQLARQYLDEERITLSEIALMLGYSEQSAFTRAFRQWTGMSPRQYFQCAKSCVE
ncbi:MAG: helix-turn-helix domain-containing protein [Marinobacter sp.]|nr:helix-turn-helix domain-containing protein [Marinobacter sp.]